MVFFCIMIQAIHQKYAELLVNYSTDVKEGDIVSLNVETPALPMARALFQEVLKAGGRPYLRLTYPEMTADVLKFASDDYFEVEPTFEMNEIKQVDAWIRVNAPLNNKSLQSADKSRMSKLMKQMRPFQNHRINQTRWCGTLFPTNAGAQDAGMSLDDYENFVYNAMFLFDDDPVAKWQEIADFQAQLIERLTPAKEVHIQAEGTDLKMQVADRVWVNSAGKKNMPSGEVFTGPIESSATGVITFDIPSSVKGGIEVESIVVTFEEGKAVKAESAKGNDFLQAQLDTDAGARFLGELGIGTNFNIQQPTKSILYDEKIGGTIHLALGQSYPETGGVNESAIHWDMICDLRKGGSIHLDGELFQENGQFKL